MVAEIVCGRPKIPPGTDATVTCTVSETDSPSISVAVMTISVSPGPFSTNKVSEADS